MAIGRKQKAGAEGRRTGPGGEAPWWDPEDQAFAERPLLARSDLGKGWQSVPMFNNAERLDPHGDDPASEELRTIRARRRLTALDEGAAWRLRRAGVLAVVRTEVFADDDPADRAAHRDAWDRLGTICLDAVWRQRWTERDRAPGWIEALRRRGDRPAVADLSAPAGSTEADAPDPVDWITVEDQTGTVESGLVTQYEHLTLWRGRALVTLTVRHGQGDDVDDALAVAAAAVLRRMAPPAR
ncbi:hypothetical protein [Aquihabitans sp. McL0605]|uniref:hypothetical protein n=1 Tax=Aquihabitans sp. McL0605 TaxID=3415671 RepID=UPI003CF9D210